MARITPAALEALLIAALEGAGFSAAAAKALARQTVLSEELGQPHLGVGHIFDYIESAKAGRINGQAVPQVSRPAPTLFLVDGQGGLPQVGFDLVRDELAAKARELGMVAFLERNATTCGALGTFVLALAEAGMVAFAGTNGPPLLAGSGASQAVYCTNPMAFAAPQAEGPPLLVDQSSSATAFVNVRAAAARGEAIPEGWAIDAQGAPTSDPKAAMEGALLAFGGARGANIALMVEVLSAGLTGANWSLDAPSILEGDACSATGLFVMAIDPAPAAPGFAARLGAQLKRLAGNYGVHIPGLAKGEHRLAAARDGLEVDDALLARLEA
jgi:(2R)-3-sulfolactate dehydrogenase (NADP+)